MTPEEHNKTLATLYFIYGAVHGLTLLGLLLLVLVVTMAAPSSLSISTFWISVAVVLFVTVLIAVALLPLIVGYGLAKRQRWVRSVGLILAVVSLINVPIGTALGIYTIKFFRGHAGAELYGGSATTANEVELQNALRGAQPLMNWADKLK